MPLPLGGAFSFYHWVVLVFSVVLDLTASNRHPCISIRQAALERTGPLALIRSNMTFPPVHGGGGALGLVRSRNRMGDVFLVECRMPDMFTRV